ncbi:hypothetical protein HPB50_004291 [Hyalomma asiaticum]|uniref:Uncharacterized protein n=1 Tax=Hyalomma asiaticum TaxID=266040 RepID=A0ACB7RY63_HYAAI|nr:hypothetical protein HPB50_004291 [Hyalomma asiaticum]
MARIKGFTELSSPRLRTDFFLQEGAALATGSTLCRFRFTALAVQGESLLPRRRAHAVSGLPVKERAAAAAARLGLASIAPPHFRHLAGGCKGKRREDEDLSSSRRRFFVYFAP